MFGGQASGTGRTILTAAIVLAVMVLPIITSMCREVFLQAPRLHEEAALALGATRWEMIKLAVLPFARAGNRGGRHAGPRPRPRRDDGGRHGVVGPGDINFQLLTSNNPNTMAANIAQNFPEASGFGSTS